MKGLLIPGLVALALAGAFSFVTIWNKQVLKNAQIASLERVIVAQQMDKEASDAQKFAIRALEARADALVAQLADGSRVCLGEHDTELLRNLWP